MNVENILAYLAKKEAAVDAKLAVYNELVVVKEEAEAAYIKACEALNNAGDVTAELNEKAEIRAMIADIEAVPVEEPVVEAVPAATTEETLTLENLI